MSQLEMSRLHETHFGSSVNSIPCTVVHSPIEVSSLSPEQLRLTPISTIDHGRTATGHRRGRRSVVGRLEESAGDGGHHNCGGGDQGGGSVPYNQDDGVPHHICGGGVPHNQLAKVRLFPLGPAAAIDKMPHVQFRCRLHKLHISLFVCLTPAS